MLFMASQILAPAEFFANPMGQYIADAAFGSVYPAAIFFGTATLAWAIPARMAWREMRAVRI
jgi:hypothetical protein